MLNRTQIFLILLFMVFTCSVVKAQSPNSGITNLPPVVTLDSFDFIYQEINNPFSVSVPNVLAKNIVVKVDYYWWSSDCWPPVKDSGRYFTTEAYTGDVKGKNGKYSLNLPIGNTNIDSVIINVYAKTNNSLKFLGAKKFKVKPIPPTELYFESFRDKEVNLRNIRYLKKLVLSNDLYPHSESTQIIKFSLLFIHKRGLSEMMNGYGPNLTESMLNCFAHAQPGDMVFIHDIKYKTMGWEQIIPGNLTFAIPNNTACSDLSFISKAENVKEKNDWAKEHLLAKVKSVKETIKTVITDTAMQIEGELWQKSKLTNYNAQGYLTGLYNFDSTNRIISATNHDYNSNGSVIETKVLDNSGNYPDSGITQYKYNKRVQKIQEISLDPDGVILGRINLKYDKSGNIIEESNYEQVDSLKAYLNWKKTYKYNLEGKIIEQMACYFEYEQLITKVYKYIKEGNQYQKSEYEFDNRFQSKYSVKKDKKGNEIGASYSISDSNLYTKFSWYFDRKRNLIEQTEYFADSAFKQKSKVKVDNRKMNIYQEKLDKQADSLALNYTSLYDSTGILIQKTGYKFEDSDYRNSEKRTFIYNNKGNIVEEIYYDFYKADSVRYKVSYKYDSSGKLNERATSGHDNASKHILSYDHNGNLILIKHSNLAKSVECECNFKYEYDSNYNWKTRVEYSDGVPSKITNRVIEYY